MAQQKYYTILTEVGKSKIANATVLNEKVQFSKMQLGDGGGSQYEPHEKQTELKNKVWEGSISNVKVDENNPNWIVVETAIPGNSGGFTVREVGLFDDSGELLAIGKYPETYKPVVDDGCIKDLFVRVILMVVNTSAITLKIDPTVILASMKDLNDLRKEVSAKIDTAKTELNSKIDEVRSDLDSIELTAEKVSVKDVENNFTSVNTEGVLQELAVKDKSLDTKIVSTKSDLTNQFDHFTGEIDNLKQSVSNGKELIATAVTGKDVPTNGGDSFEAMADNIDSIKTKLPILEGDAGVTELEDGQICGVTKIEQRQTYKTDINLEKVWTKDTQDAAIALKADSNFIYSSGSEGYVYKHDFNGNEVWRYKDIYYNSYLAVDEENIYFANSTSINKMSKDKNLLWTKKLTNKGSIQDLSVDSTGNTFVSTSTGYIIKIDTNGEEKWFKQPITNNLYAVSVDTEGNSYTGGLSGYHVYKYSPNGELTWEKKLSNTQIQTLYIDSFNKIIYVGDSNGQLNKVSLEGGNNTIWNKQVLGRQLKRITLDQQFYPYISHEASRYIFKIEPSSGDYIWRYDAQNTLYNAIALDAGKNFIIYSDIENTGINKLSDNYTIETLALLEGYEK
jgi:hypothetical protein